MFSFFGRRKPSPEKSPVELAEVIADLGQLGERTPDQTRPIVAKIRELSLSISKASGPDGAEQYLASPEGITQLGALLKVTREGINAPKMLAPDPNATMPVRRRVDDVLAAETEIKWSSVMVDIKDASTFKSKEDMTNHATDKLCSYAEGGGKLSIAEVNWLIENVERNWKFNKMLTHYADQMTNIQLSALLDEPENLCVDCITRIMKSKNASAEVKNKIAEDKILTICTISYDKLAMLMGLDGVDVNNKLKIFENLRKRDDDKKHVLLCGKAIELEHIELLEAYFRLNKVVENEIIQMVIGIISTGLNRGKIRVSEAEFFGLNVKTIWEYSFYKCKPFLRLLLRNSNLSQAQFATIVNNLPACNYTEVVDIVLQSPHTPKAIFDRECTSSDLTDEYVGHLARNPSLDVVNFIRILPRITFEDLKQCIAINLEVKLWIASNLRDSKDAFGDQVSLTESQTAELIAHLAGQEDLMPSDLLPIIPHLKAREKRKLMNRADVMADTDTLNALADATVIGLNIYQRSRIRQARRAIKRRRELPPAA